MSSSHILCHIVTPVLYREYYLILYGIWWQTFKNNCDWFTHFNKHIYHYTLVFNVWKLMIKILLDSIKFFTKCSSISYSERNTHNAFVKMLRYLTKCLDSLGLWPILTIHSHILIFSDLLQIWVCWKKAFTVILYSHLRPLFKIWRGTNCAFN